MPTSKPLQLEHVPLIKRIAKVLGVALVLWLIFVIVLIAYLVIFTSPKGDAKAVNDAPDKRVLEVVVTSPLRDVFNPFTEITITSNKEITMQDNNRVTFRKEGAVGNSLIYVVRVNNLPVDTTKLTLKLEDKVGNKLEKEVVITRKPFSFPVGMTSVVAWDDAAYILNGDDFKAQVGKKHRLLEDYEPQDLVDLNKGLGLYTLNNAQLRSEAAYALKDMLAELTKQTGKYVTVASGYRSFTTQLTTYAANVKQIGQKKADEVSARPGNSEHQLGTAVDFVNDETGWTINAKFGETAAGKWLAENCGKYGFIQPYKTSDLSDDGYKEESWHFRYVGIATE